METTEKRRRGRPQRGEEKLQVIQIMISPALRKAAEKLASKKNKSLSEVYRDWMERGKKRAYNEVTAPHLQQIPLKNEPSP
jgi:hypothetical protein